MGDGILYLNTHCHYMSYIFSISIYRHIYYLINVSLFYFVSTFSYTSVLTIDITLLILILIFFLHICSYIIIYLHIKNKPAAPPPVKKTKLPSLKVPGGNKAVNDTGAWLEISWSLLPYEDFENYENHHHHHLQTTSTSNQDGHNNQDINGFEIEDPFSQKHSTSSSSNPHSNPHSSPLHGNPYRKSRKQMSRARSFDDIPSERWLEGPSWPPYSEYPVKFVSGSELDPFNQWEWVPGTTHHFQVSSLCPPPPFSLFLFFKFIFLSKFKFLI